MTRPTQENYEMACSSSAHLATAAYAAEPKPNAETFLDPSKAGQDYPDQGEYRNDWGVRRSSPPSRQLSDGDLPRRFARRWLGQEFKQETPGKREGNKIVFAGEDSYRAEPPTARSPSTQPTVVLHMEKTGERAQRSAKPPTGAVVLFDGTSADAWPGGHMDQRKLLPPAARANRASAISKRTWNSCCPFNRWFGSRPGNSGVFAGPA